MNVSQIKAIGFDVDGTLYTYSPQVSVALSQEVARIAAQLLNRSEDDFAEEFLVAREKYRSNTLALNSLGLNGQEIYQKVVDEFPLEKHEKGDTKLVTLIADLKKKYQLFIISNGTGRQVERKLKTLGLNPADFDPNIYCYDHNWAKPEPAPFLAAIDALAVKSEEIVYIGDREDVDIQGAQAVGMQTILVGEVSQVATASVTEIYGLSDIFLS